MRANELYLPRWTRWYDAFELPCTGPDAGGGLAGLLLLREPVAHRVNPVEDEATYLDAGRTTTARGESLQRSDGAV
ncbi:MAG: hypothetical protein WCA20_24265 [Candidatus Sulfotelmatobacter sp.]